MQSSTLATPSVPTTNPPIGWSVTEPSYKEGSTDTLYTVDLVVLTDGSWLYSEVSKSSSYEAAKEAYNKAVEAAKTATNFADFESGTGVVVGNMTESTLGSNTLIDSEGMKVRKGNTVLSLFAAKLIELGKNATDAVIRLCGGKAQIAYGSVELGDRAAEDGMIIESDGIGLKGKDTFIWAKND